MKITKTTLAAIGALAIVSTTSYAASRAEVYIGPAQYELIDLNTADGVLPTLSLSIAEPNVRPWISSAFVGNGQNDLAELRTPDVNNDDIDFHLSRGSVEARSTITGRSSPADLAISTVSIVSDDIEHTWNYSRSEAYNNFDFHLSANSQVIFTIPSRLTAVISDSDILEQAYAVMSVTGYIYGDWSTFVGGSLVVQSQNIPQMDPNTIFDGVRTLTFTNTSDHEVRGSIGYGAITQAALVVPEIPAVPEPSTYGMLLAGLGLMGFAARRLKA